MDFINKDKHFVDFVQTVLSNKRRPPFLFVGSGISSGSDLPNWSGFINGCVAKAFRNDITVQALADVHSIDKNDIWLIDAAKEQAKKKNISEYDLIHEALWGLAPEKIKASALHYLIVRYAYLMNTPIFTTNYDTLLEEAAEYLKIKMPIYERVGKKVNINKFCLIYLHGRLAKEKIKDKVKSKAVATKVSYYKHFNKTPEQIIKFRDLLKKKSCIFVGAGMKDDNINRCLLHSKTKRTTHYWFTNLEVDNYYKKGLYQDLWNHLNVNPIYCRTRSFDEIKTAFRRAINQLDFQEPESSSIEINKKMYSSINTQITEILTSETFKTLLDKCRGPYDETEFDLYMDFSTKENSNIFLKRVWSENTPYSDFENKQKRIFKIGKKVSDASYAAGMKQNFSLVEESMDSLSIHKYLRSPTDSPKSPELSNPRAWGYVSFPVIIPEISRCGAIFILRYLNENNRLQSGFNTDFNGDIIKLGKHLSDEFLKRARIR